LKGVGFNSYPSGYASDATGSWSVIDAPMFHLRGLLNRSKTSFFF